MKKLLLMIGFALSSLNLNAQEIKPIFFTEVVKVDSTKTAKELFSSARIWFANSFKNPKDVVALDDPDSSTIIGKGTMAYNSNIFMGGQGRSGWISFDIKIVTKDGRYKYDFDNFHHKGNILSFGLITDAETLPQLSGLNGGSKNYKEKVTKEVKGRIDEVVTNLIFELKNEMDKKTSSKENW